MPGLLKCFQFNKKITIPQKVFEVSDCVVLDATSETGARNVRKICAMYLNQTSDFEVIHGLLDMLMNKVGAKMGEHYRILQDDDDPRYLPTRGVEIQLNGSKIGSMGVLHPEVLNNFELTFPVSALEIDFNAMFEHF